MTTIASTPIFRSSKPLASKPKLGAGKPSTGAADASGRERMSEEWAP